MEALRTSPDAHYAASGSCVPASRRSLGQRLGPYLWFAPLLVLLLAVTFVPAVLVFWLSFQKTRYFQPMGFVGLSNYVLLLTSGAFWSLTRNSLTYVFGTLALVLPTGLFAALILQRTGRFGSVLRPILLVPWTLSMAVVGSLWLWLFNPSFGPLSYMLTSLGIDSGLMLGDLNLALPLVILTTAWWSFPYAMVIFTAAIQAIPADLYEAVELDGGGALAKFRHVTFPFILPTFGSTALTLAILYLTLVTMIIVLTGGGPLGMTATWSFEIFRTTFQDVNVSPAAVMSIVVLFVNLVLGFTYSKLSGRSML